MRHPAGRPERKLRAARTLLGCLFLAGGVGETAAQDLEPRRWSNLPTGAAFVGAGYRYTSADIFVDPTLELEEVESTQEDLVISGVYAFEWMNRPARLELLLPFARARWSGLLAGEAASTSRHGLRDATFRLSLSAWGAPALSGPAFAAWTAQNPVNTTVGLGVLVSAPTGEYLDDRLLNLGNNRWTVRPQAGILHTRHHWQFELTGTLSWYGSNEDFLEDSTQRTDPLWFVQGHVIRTFRPGLWTSVSLGLTEGGENEIDGRARGDTRRETFWAFSLGLPISRAQGIKLAWIHSETSRDVGFDSDTVLLAWSLMLAP